MTEAEKQEEFREEVRADLATQGTMLESLDNRVKALEQTVTHGNGHPALTVQVKELEAKVDNLSKEVSNIKDSMSKIDRLNEIIIEIKTQMKLGDKSKSTWIQFAFIIVTIIGTYLANRFLG